MASSSLRPNHCHRCRTLRRSHSPRRNRFLANSSSLRPNRCHRCRTPRRSHSLLLNHCHRRRTPRRSHSLLRPNRCRRRQTLSRSHSLNHCHRRQTLSRNRPPTDGDSLVPIRTCEVTYDLPLFGSGAKGDRRKSKDTGFIHSHLQGSETSAKKFPNSFGKPCFACGRDGHRVADCEQFNAATVDERWKLVEQKGLCKTCLNSHGRWPCRSWSGCEVEGCRHKHHTLLHISSPSQQNVNITASHITRGHYNWPLFRILPVVLYGSNCSKTIFAFIDEGSSYTLLDQSVAKQLDVTGPTDPLTLQWTGN
ncbi:hypothetical protein pipiens_019560, partial [Culex pipiens pipiens]